MEAYRRDCPIETQEVDARVGAADEFKEMLRKLQQDDLPRFEMRFKELLNGWNRKGSHSATSRTRWPVFSCDPHWLDRATAHRSALNRSAPARRFPASLRRN
jgi:hypothetical protein